MCLCCGCVIQGKSVNDNNIMEGDHDDDDFDDDYIPDSSDSEESYSSVEGKDSTDQFNQIQSMYTDNYRVDNTINCAEY